MVLVVGRWCGLREAFAGEVVHDCWLDPSLSLTVQAFPCYHIEHFTTCVGVCVCVSL